MFRFLRRGGQITRIDITPPRPKADRAGIALILIVRNEEAHIAEWARFHRLAGVSRFIVYDNGCTDGTIPALRSEIPDAIILPWAQKFLDGKREVHNQVLAYAHAVANFGADVRWMSFVDVDEFLVPKQAKSLPDALAHLGDIPQISLPWHMFGRSGHMTPPPGGVLANYTKRNPDPMSDEKGLRNFKMIVDPCRVTSLKVHQIWTDNSPQSWNDRGETAKRESKAFYSTDHIQLNHYYTRSDAELRAKIARGPNLSTPDADHLRRVMRKVAAIEAAEIEDRSALDYLARLE